MHIQGNNLIPTKTLELITDYLHKWLFTHKIPCHDSLKLVVPTFRCKIYSHVTVTQKLGGKRTNVYKLHHVLILYEHVTEYIQNTAQTIHNTYILWLWIMYIFCIFTGRCYVYFYHEISTDLLSKHIQVCRSNFKPCVSFFMILFFCSFVRSHVLINWLRTS